MRGRESRSLDGISRDQAVKDLEYFTSVLVSLDFTPGYERPQLDLRQLGTGGFARLFSGAVTGKGSGCR